MLNIHKQLPQAKVLPYIKSLPEDNTDAWTNENVAEPHFKNLIDYDKVDMAHYIAKATSGGGGTKTSPFICTCACFTYLPWIS